MGQVTGPVWGKGNAQKGTSCSVTFPCLPILASKTLFISWKFYKTEGPSWLHSQLLDKTTLKGEKLVCFWIMK
jgi:hypothetical protein